MKKPIVVSDAAYHAALVASAQAPRNPWQLEAVRYVEEGNKIALIFAQGVELVVPASMIPQFSSARPEQLSEIYLTPSGEIIVVNELDVHLGTKELIEAALTVLPGQALNAKFGARGGARSSAAKKISSAENGKKGGRPPNATRQAAMQGVETDMPQLQPAAKPLSGGGNGD